MSVNVSHFQRGRIGQGGSLHTTITFEDEHVAEDAKVIELNYATDLALEERLREFLLTRTAKNPASRAEIIAFMASYRR